MKKKHTPQSAFFTPRTLLALLLCSVAASSMVSGALLAFIRHGAPSKFSQRTLTFEERAAYRQAIEDVYWRHRIWSKENAGPKPSLDAVMSQAQLEKKVEDYLHKSEALEDYWQRPITAEQLQAELIAWPGTQNSRKSCGNCLRFWGTIHLFLLSAWRGRC